MFAPLPREAVPDATGSAPAKWLDRLSTYMPDRILKVNAYTTFDLLDGEATGHGWTDEALAILDVTAPRENPDHVSLQLELDNTDLENLPSHADSVTLSAEQARTLAAELQEQARRVEETSQ